ncbi:uncharacterized protein LOC132902159 [Amyelois transitella]|uniref:uncharacterized protein LOC132902159 n=1 Tax=Amyelois transitella TaxID=680683 RepID=UPI00298FAFB5|nr:uncharacterized protein LOC132902159 [Amyelois transitella]
MTSDVARNLSHQAQAINSSRYDERNPSFFGVDHPAVHQAPYPGQEGSSGSTYTLASTQSQFSYAVDNWLRAVPAISPVATTDVAVQDSAPRQTQPTNNNNNYTNSGIWYILAMILPLVSLNNNNNNWTWGCSASTVLHAAEIFSTQINYLLRGIHRNLRSLVQDQVSRDLFATAMDVVLIIYAMGFLVISLYQASIFN